MYVIEVIPLIRGTDLESLSYYSSVAYEPGTFLEVPVRGKNQCAMTIKSEPVSTAKAALRAATFSLRKLPVQPKALMVPPTIQQMVRTLVTRYPASFGSILFAILPPDIRSGLRKYVTTKGITHHEETTPQILMARFDERFLSYQSHIRSTFAKRGSVLFVVPTATDVGYAAKDLGHGIEDRLVILAPGMSTKKYERAIEALMDTTFPKLIITTPSFAYLEREDIHTIIIEQSASAHYIDRRRPYLDHREALCALAKAAGRSIICGDTVVRTEDEALRRDDTYLTYGEAPKRMVFSAPLTIIKQADKPHVETPFSLFSPSLRKSVSRTLEGNGHVFLFSARRGLAPVVACIDCGFIFRCPDSRTPYSLIRTEKNGVEERWFVSSTSGRRVRAADVCDHCGSWRLRERGIGIQHVYDEWKEQVPDSPVFLIDHTSAPTNTKAQKIITDFFSHKSAVLIGTQIALPYLHRGVTLSAVVSLDAARSTPTWRADESLFRLLIKLRECSEKEVIVQTRGESDPLVTYATRGEIERFFDDEIILRQQLKYPPFYTFFLLTWSGTVAMVQQTDTLLKELLAAIPAQFYSNPHGSSAHYIRHALIRVKNTDVAAYQAVLTVLRSLPPHVKLEVNPERII